MENIFYYMATIYCYIRFWQSVVEWEETLKAEAELEIPEIPEEHFYLMNQVTDELMEYFENRIVDPENLFSGKQIKIILLEQRFRQAAASA